MNKMNYLKINFFALIAFAVTLSACKKDRAERDYERQLVGTNGIYVLSEGDWNQANPTISYYDIEKKTTVKDYYRQVNGTGLGETANDLQAYGNKMYCVVTGVEGKAQSFVDVMDVKTGKSIKRIPFNTTNNGFLPRYITFYKNKAYVSRYDGAISRIDTASLNVDGELQLKNGANNAGGLEGLAVANGKLYVTNSAHPSYPTSLKSKVTIVDLATFTKSKDIEVGNNPVRISAASNGDLYVITWNDWVTFNDPTLVRISSTTDAVTQTEANTDLGAINIVGTQAWVTKDVYSSPSIKALNLATGKLGSNLITDATAIATPYGITINPFDDSVVVGDSGSSKAFVFGKDGKLKYSFETGSNPQAAVFNHRYAFVSKD
ncbi:MAG: hypothetical protein REI64_15375 [Pedobacter sp.]|uniref:DUF5074 domain-containing protein n=1 Tax=Pedobacter sp. TaxID=1411316 RepID=UPI002806AB84|nr:DUF5074 domain-containing protein [Pedobacter sp.]MDQ8006181.1 hypothetical protein [Pedobacter sp.]